jgi:hypothetical protein
VKRWSMAVASPCPSLSQAPMCLIRNWLPKLWIASRSSALSSPLKHLTIFASIKAIPVSRSIARFVRAAT